MAIETGKIRVTQRVLAGIMAIRDSGRTNMCDWRTVQVIANELGCYELVVYLEDNWREYCCGISAGFEALNKDE